MPSANPTPHPLDAAARDELARIAEKLHVLGNNLAVCDCHDGRCIVQRAKELGASDAHRLADALSALLASVRGAEAETARLDHYRECAAKWCGYRLIPEDTTVRPDAASHVKPSEFDAMMDEYRAARAHPPIQETDADAN